MLEAVKNLVTLKNIDHLINTKQYELALEKLNLLIKDGFRPAETYFKRGLLCRMLLMNDDAYSDFTYVIGHCENNLKAYKERMYLNFEISNFAQAITDAEQIMAADKTFFDAHRIKFLSLVFSSRIEEGKKYIYNYFGENKFKTIQFLLNETAFTITKDELAKGLKILEVLELIDADNPMKLLKEATIYGIAGDENKKNEILNKISSIFPKYFISHFKFSDIYESRDLLEVCFLLELKVFDTQNLFAYPLTILEGYKNNMEGHIIDSKECFERAIAINPDKPEAYVLLGETLQLMSGYENIQYRKDAEANYKKALEIYEQQNLPTKIDAMKRQIKHLNSGITIGM